MEEIKELEDSEIEKYLALSKEKLIAELKKLDPELRINVIKKIEQARKKEQEETASLMKESLEQVSIEDALKDVPTPEIDEVRLDDLFAGESIDSSIEELPKVPSLADGYMSKTQQENVDYASDLYGQLKDMYDNASSGNVGYDTARDIADRLDNFAKYKSDTEHLREIADGAKSILKKIKGEYVSQFDYSPHK